MYFYRFFATFRICLPAIIFLLGLSYQLSVRADETVDASLPSSGGASIIIESPAKIPNVSLLDRATDTAQAVLDQAVGLLGAPYRWGGNTTTLGFDCSGFVTHVFQMGLGLTLPRTAKAISRTGRVIPREDLQPGDLVFFNTMRRAFSHVGIYLGNNRFIHAPRSGEEVRIDNLYDYYWIHRFNGARRIDAE
jgi:cell wall-associated NlpC family hydrolase